MSEQSGVLPNGVRWLRIRKRLMRRTFFGGEGPRYAVTVGDGVTAYLPLPWYVFAYHDGLPFHHRPAHPEVAALADADPVYLFDALLDHYPEAHAVAAGATR